MKTNLMSLAAALTVLALMAPASGQGLPVITTDATSTNNSWEKDMAGIWTNSGTGFYFNQECSWIETPILPGAILATDPSLKFTYTFSIEKSSWGGFAYDGSAFLLSKDAGATWAVIPSGLENSPSYHTLVRNCATGMGAAAPASVISGTGMGTASVDLTSVAPTDLFQVRLMLGTDFSVIRDGWTISAITLGGLPIE